MTTQQVDFYKKASKLGLIDDDKNPIFTFNQTSSDVLVMILNGKIDPSAMIKSELSNRGLDESGKFVGFKKTDPAKLEASKKSKAQAAAKKVAAKKVVDPKDQTSEK